MFLRRASGIALLSAFIATIMFARPARAAQPGPMYWVCSYDTRTKPTSVLYVSDVTGPFGQRMQNNYTATVLSNEFTQFLNATYKIAVAGSCTGYESLAKAQEAIKNRIEFAPSAKLVETHWKSTTPAEAASPANRGTPQPAGNTQPGTVVAGALQGYCYAYTNQNFFITKPFLYGRDNGQGVDQEFSDFLVKKYGVPAGTSSRCASLRDPQLVANARQNEISDSKRTARQQMVEFDWAPSPKAAAAPQKPAPAVAAPPPPKPTPPPSGAVAAPNTSAKPPASTTPAPAPPAAAMYSYCYAYGTPAGAGGGSVKQHFYISQPFQVAGSAGLNQEFEKFLGSAHAGEKISASCLSPGPLDAAQKNRQQTIDLKRKQTAAWDVVEVNWKR